MQGVPFFFPQLGGVRKAKNGSLLDGRTYDEYSVGATHRLSPERRTHTFHLEA
jgi:protein gp37